MATSAVADETGLGSLSLEEAAVSVHCSVQFDSSSGQRVILSGPAEALGNYDPAKSVALEYQHSGRWCSTVTFPLLLALSPRVALGSEEAGRAGAPASAADAPTVAADGDGTTRLVESPPPAGRPPSLEPAMRRQWRLQLWPARAPWPSGL